MTSGDVNVVRTWRRDGSANVMSLEAAAANLASNRPQTEVGVKQAARQYAQCLLQGERVETPLAVFALEGIAP